MVPRSEIFGGISISPMEGLPLQPVDLHVSADLGTGHLTRSMSHFYILHGLVFVASHLAQFN